MDTVSESVRMRLRCFFLLLVLFVTNTVMSQDNSNKGKEFWIAYPAHIDGISSVMGIYITSDVNAKGKIQVGNTTTLDFTVVANEVTRVFLGSSGTVDASNNDVYLNMADGIKTNGAIRVTSDEGVVVYSHIIRSARSGASLVLPTPVLGNEYIVPSYGSNSGSAPTSNGSRGGIGIISVIATQPNTIIEITPSVQGVNGRPATTYQVTLNNAGDVYQFQGREQGDISGSVVRSIASGGSGSCKPIAVFSATTWSTFDCTGATGGDNLYQQLFPTRAWGKQFVTAPFIGRSYNIYRIYVTNANTKVHVTDNGVVSQLGASLYNAGGKFYTMRSASALAFEADAPISVVQYMTSQTCNTGCNVSNPPESCFSDPEMVILNPVEQTLDKITFFSAHSDFVPRGQTAVTKHYVNIIIKKNYKSSLRIDNFRPSASFIDIPGTDYAYLQEDLTTSSRINPVHRVTADTSFSAIVYGYGSVESYGYNGGTNVKDFSKGITMVNPYNRIDSAVTCSNTPTQFAIPLNYQPTSIRWNFSAAQGIAPNTDILVNGVPQPDSTVVVNGQSLYYFSPGSTFTFANVSTASRVDTVKLYTTTATPDGCGSTDQVVAIPIKVKNKPVADFTWSHTGCEGEVTTFRVPDTNNFGRWIWDLGNGIPMEINFNVHGVAYNAGTYQIKLRTISDEGCISDEVTKAVTVTGKPVASFTASSIMCVDGDILFTDASTTTSGTITKWTWNLDNGAGATEVNSNALQTARYNTTGPKNITLQVETQTGCKSDVFTPATPVYVHPKPNAGFRTQEVCLSDAHARFTDTSSISDGSEASFTYLWNFNAGSPAVSLGPNITTSTLQHPEVKYNKADHYIVTQQVTSKDGCVATSSQPFTVNGALPKAEFVVESNDPLCSKEAVVIVDRSSVDFGNIIRSEIFWNRVNAPSEIETFKDPQVNTRYAHLYPVSGSAGQTFEIKMVAYSGGVCMNEYSRTVTVYPNPKAAYTASSTAICIGETVQFTDQSAAVSPVLPVRWVWDLGQQSPSSIANPLKDYRDSGIFVTSLYTYSADGCVSDTANLSITVSPKPILDIGTQNYTVLEGGKVTLTPSFVYGNGLQYQWLPATYLSSAVVLSPIAQPLADINYRLTVTSAQGCATSDQVFVKVLKSPEVPNAFSPNGDGVHDTWNIKYLDSYAEATVEVFNRYGQLVYRSKGYARPWDGTMNGKQLPIGTYYYIIDPKNGKVALTGSLTIIR